MNNASMRVKFKDYYNRNFKPNLSLVAKELGITREYLTNWSNGKRDCSTEMLNNIDKFIRKHDTNK